MTSTTSEVVARLKTEHTLDIRDIVQVRKLLDIVAVERSEAAALITTLVEANAELTAERDDLAEIAAKYRIVCDDRDSWRRTAEQCKSESLAAERLLAEAREALKPFAALGEHAAWMEKPDDKGAWGFDDAMLTWGDFRKAHQALEAQP
jgi:hypothetical protein